MPNLPTLNLLSPTATTDPTVWSFAFFPTFSTRVFPDKSVLNYDVDIDVVRTFSSPNAKHFTKTSAIDSTLIAMQDGDLGSSFDVKLSGPDRTREVVWYWRARVSTPVYVSEYVEGNPLTVPTQDQLAITQQMWNALADGSSYSKDANSATLFVILNAFSRQITALKREIQQSQLDLYINTVRDEALQRNFATLVGASRNSSELAVDFRVRVWLLWQAYVKSQKIGSVTGVIDTVKAFVLEAPEIIDERTRRGWILGEHFIKDPLVPTLSPIITLYSRASKGFTWTLNVFNSWGFVIDEQQIRDFVRRVIPLHTKVTVLFPSWKNSEEAYDRARDWSRCTLTNVDAVNDTVRLNASAPALSIDSVMPKSLMRFLYDGQTLPHFSNPIWTRSLTGSVGLEEIFLDVPATSNTSLHVQMPIGPSTSNILQYTATPSYLGDAYKNTRGVVASIRLKLPSGILINAGEQPHFGVKIATGLYLTFGSDSVAIQDTTGTIYTTVSGINNTSYVEYQIWYRSSTVAGSDCVVMVLRNGVQIIDTTIALAVSSTIDLQFSSHAAGPYVEGFVDYFYAMNVPLAGVVKGPVVDSSTGLNAWDIFTQDLTLSGQAVGFQVRSGDTLDAEDLTWSSWEALENLSAPVSTPLVQNFQLRGILASWSVVDAPISHLPIIKSASLAFQRI